ncbi:GntR family transcriptional regulator [Nesterenkonia sp. HG001]|uniref:GntR family transcriptional regulator n=1 Tax=Nesterenkonia sp. HG001 TaxID=2983207 RepID=UPI002AC54941|nr:GntR family transcriptional regulator [Nesterenkonia sp. HG001]MDZ5078248.1 GntR family transcriptional regulator [Nesterenkonia sp. HG001]
MSNSSNLQTPGASAPGADSRPPVARRALRDEVYSALFDRILNGSAPAGSSMSIDALARDLDVSPTPVREALVQLEHTGLVTRVALKGYRVAPQLTGDQLRELFEMRMIVEMAAVERAANSWEALLPRLRAAHARHVRTADRVRALRTRRDDADAAGAAPDDFEDLREYMAADRDFHRVILEAAGNRYLLQTSESLSAHVQRLRQTVDHGELDLDEALAEHAAVLTAFESGDPEQMRHALRIHLEAVADRVHGDD